MMHVFQESNFYNAIAIVYLDLAIFGTAPMIIYEDFENIRWYLTHRHISVHIDDEGDGCILIDNHCRNLVKTAKGLRCKDYANRPLICRKFSPANCDFTKGGYDLEEDRKHYYVTPSGLVVVTKDQQLAAEAQVPVLADAWV